MVAGINVSRRSLLIGVLVAIIISDSIIFFAEIKSKTIYSNWIISINASIAAFLAVFLLYIRKNIPGEYRDTRIALAIGLSLWLCADLIWATYEIVLEIVPPVPSAADFLWLSAYGSLAYYLYRTYILFHKQFRFKNRTLFLTAVGCAIFLSYIVTVTTSLADLSSTRGIAIFAVIVTYPIFDAILMVPAIVILVNFRNEPLWFTPWVCECAGILLIAMSDSWFVPVILTSLVNQLWISSLFFAAHYLVIAGGLFWFLTSYAYHHDEHAIKGLETSPKVTFSSTTSDATTRSDNNNDYTLKKRKQKNKVRLSYRIIAVIAIIMIVAVIVGISSSRYYSSSSNAVAALSPVFGIFGIPNLEITIKSADSQPTVTFGALLPLTGTSSQLGESEKAALEIGVKDINDYFSKTHSKTRIGLIIEDTQTDPTISLQKLKQLQAKGIKIVIGPATSAAVQGVKDYADKNGILLISASSTAPSANIRGKESENNNTNIFRLVPDDTHQAQAISQQMWKDGIRVVIPFWRTDIYGNGLVNATTKYFEQLGGKVIDGIGYVPYTGDFSASLNRINFMIWDHDLKSLESKINQAESLHGLDKIGVYVVAYDEIAPIFIQAQERHDVLSRVKWYGSDGSALVNTLVRNAEAATFATKTGFPNPIYGVENDNDARLKQVEAEMHKKLERPPRSYAYVAYDILWITSLTQDSIKKTNSPQSNSADSFKQKFREIASTYKGITGNTTLNKVGDRRFGDYDLWAIRATNKDNFAWGRVGKYVNGISSTLP
jgi:ABC-type branched-subunit amino acid transport system substrate-binding protein